MERSLLKIDPGSWDRKSFFVYFTVAILVVTEKCIYDRVSWPMRPSRLGAKQEYSCLAYGSDGTLYVGCADGDVYIVRVSSITFIHSVRSRPRKICRTSEDNIHD